MSMKQAAGLTALVVMSNLLSVPTSIHLAGGGRPTGTSLVSTARAQAMFEGGFLNSKAKEEGKAVGAEKKKEGEAAAKEGNALKSLTEKMEAKNEWKPGEFSTRKDPLDPNSPALGEGKTQGWLRTEEGTSKVASPSQGGAQSGWPNRVREAMGETPLGKNAAEAAAHAEGEAAGMMKEGQKAVLDINNEICGKCKDALPHILPPESELTVRSLDTVTGRVVETVIKSLRIDPVP